MNIGILKRVDGTVAIVTPTQEGIDTYGFDGVMTQANPTSLPITIVDNITLPTDRVFRNAWEEGVGGVAINRIKAETIHMNRLRYLRKQQLLLLDKEYLMADENNNPAEKQAITLKKNQLRDMPTTFDLSVFTLEQLKTAKPTYLYGDVALLHSNVFTAESLI